ncbi:MAG: hypothetical protein KGL68_09365 [Burkholderiales bacterium]|nr:hypothetical protein [Burkholderiales bacterium]
MSFAIAATATGGAAIALGTGWLFAGPLLLKRWRIGPDPAALLVGRRLGAVYLGMSVILLLARTQPASPLRTALSAGMLLALVALAALGVYEFIARRAAAAILVSVVLELVLASLFASDLLGM